ncbi:hypothetical protein N665_0100s0008 [Sinapis alba]|nr:hypothetical protein N665_0100s0008 [Sinapis alba]
MLHDSLFFFSSSFHLLCSHLSHLSTLSQNHPINKIYHTTITITSEAAISVSSFSTSVNEAVSITITITSAAATIIYISTSSFFTSTYELCLNHSFYLSSYQSFFFSRCIFTGQRRGSGIDNGAGVCSCYRKKPDMKKLCWCQARRRKRERGRRHRRKEEEEDGRGR